LIVVDTSALIQAVVGRAPDGPLVRRLSEDGDLHAPHLIDVEIVHALRRLVHLRQLTTDRAQDALHDVAALAVTRYPHEHLVPRMWLLRQSHTAYDAAFVALSEALGAPLVTCDSRLARSRGHDASIELFAAA
jgi:predicted nucleic acid-binding protein